MLQVFASPNKGYSKAKQRMQIKSSSESDDPNPFLIKKKLNKNLLLDRYIFNLQRKTLSKQDNKLLEVLGFQDTVNILSK